MRKPTFRFLVVYFCMFAWMALDPIRAAAG
jgi:hypothetical protein